MFLFQYLIVQIVRSFKHLEGWMNGSKFELVDDKTWSKAGGNKEHLKEKSALGKVLSIKNDNDDDADMESDREFFPAKKNQWRRPSKRSKQQNENKYYFVMLKIKINKMLLWFSLAAVEIYVSNVNECLLKPALFIRFEKGSDWFKTIFKRLNWRLLPWFG